MIMNVNYTVFTFLVEQRRELGDLPQLSIVCAPASAYHSQKPSIEGA